MTIRTILHASLAALVLAGIAAAPARAQSSIGAVVYTQSGNGLSSTGTGVIAGTSAGIPATPVRVGLTAFIPISSGGGYAATIDGSFAFGADAIGAGLGFGQFGRAHSGTTATVFYDHRFAPHLALELRAYRTMAAEGSTAGLAALKFTL